jgi:putative transposase
MMAAGGAAMPWQETCVMDQRIGLIVACLAGEESMAALCRHFGISRKTGHKWLARYRADGVAGLADRSRAPSSNALAIGEDVVAAVLAVPSATRVGGRARPRPGSRTAIRTRTRRRRARLARCSSAPD